MCKVTIDIDEKTLRGYNPEFADTSVIRQWVQDLVDSRVNEMKTIREQKFVEVDIDSL